MSQVKKNCHLCGRQSDLQKSHIWPRFAYKRYVADQGCGGRFTDLQSLSRHNRQITQPWLCSACEQMFGKFETSTAELLRRVDEAGDQQVRYDGSLRPFAVSLSWRVAKYYRDRAIDLRSAAYLRPAITRWREFLTGRKRTVGPYTQHALIAIGQNIEGKDAEFHRGLGGEVFMRENFLLSRVGPLLMIALLDRAKLSAAERKAWDKSEIGSSGGVLARIMKNQPDESLTYDLAWVLNRHERELAKRASSVQSGRHGA